MADELARRHRWIATPIDSEGRGVNLLVYEGGAFVDGASLARTIATDLLGDDAKPGRIDDSTTLLKEKHKRREEELNQRALDLICVENGMLDWRSGELLPHSPDYLCTFKINARYDPEANAPRVGQFVAEVFPPDAQMIAEEVLGYAIIPDTSFQRAFLFVGEGANGKGRFLESVEALVGPENVSHVALQSLGDNRFAAAELQGRLLNIYPDLPSKALESSDIFKSVVAGESIMAEKKHMSPFTLRPKVRLLYSANEMPQSKDLSFGYFRRWVVVPFPNTFKSPTDMTGSQSRDKLADKNLKEKLTTPEARATWLNLAIRGLRRLREQNDFSRPPSVVKAGEEYRHDLDSVRSFIEEYVETAPGQEAGKKVLYEAYRKYCIEANILKVESARSFNKRLVEATGAVQGQRGTKRTWVGIALKDSTIETQQEEPAEEAPAEAQAEFFGDDPARVDEARRVLDGGQ